MWLLLFVVTLQLVVIFEFVLNLIITVLCNARCSDMRKLAHGSFCGNLLALTVSAVTIPVEICHKQKNLQDTVVNGTKDRKTSLFNSTSE